MNYQLMLIQKHLPTIVLLSGLGFCSLSIFTMFKSHQQLANPTLIAIDENGTRIVDRNTDPIFKTEAVNFVKAFVNEMYNLNPDNCDLKINQFSSLMSHELWKIEQEKLINVAQTLKRDNISFKSIIRAIDLNADGQYAVTIDLVQSTRGYDEKKIVNLTLKLVKQERTTINPYGIVVESYNEKNL